MFTNVDHSYELKTEIILSSTHIHTMKETKKTKANCPDCGFPNNGHDDKTLKNVNQIEPDFIRVESKNAYEIRLDIIKIASSFAESKWHAELYKNKDAVSRQDEQKYDVPQDNRTEETLNCAKRLYEFVQWSR
jgi:hypothetical protein